ncbi:MerR family transcriptional regulator [Actinopolymorpha pittospori]|uniref:DNA-binding transcriptional MerR regulator n=1 Tax=Actinopolymorpha pittospori TaxID=648752 RepID=A0A927N3K8_9ACTN|nr:MerR family transcriptional regulator [Actinopolymorpha pittospori]MBE1609673.1 DNA-binding transcriptional MerR regulator [Actinopolymorpha pittospori]
MFSIGDFAKLGRVSVRMLRHYDALGLLSPAVVDPATGYRLYEADQLRRLNRVVALKDLGFTLEQVGAILDDKVNAEELRGMLRLRRAQLEAQISADTDRLTGVEARLRMIETEGRMLTEDVVLKHIPAVRVAELAALAASYEGKDIGPVIQPLYPRLCELLDAAAVGCYGPSIAYYEPAPEVSEEAVTVHAAMTVSVGPDPAYDFAILDLPEIESAATIVHRGSMDEADRSMQILARWIEDNGYHIHGYAREVCLEFDPQDPDKWVHEFQVSVTRG